MNKASIESMIKIFKSSGLKYDDEIINKFWEFYNLLLKYNEEFDLSRLKKFEDIIIKHFVDSVYVSRMIEIPSPMLDIGTGAGFPGIPLKIINPDLEIILGEPRYKRVKFMEMAIEKIGLEKIDIYPHLVTEKSFFEVNSVITRALESIDNTLSRVSHFLPENGRVIFMKGPEGDSDADKISDINNSNYELESDRDYTLPGTDYLRKIMVYRKKGSSFKKTYRIFLNTDETKGHAITSAENKKYKEIKKIANAEGLKKHGSTIISGKKLIREAAENRALEKESLVIFDGYIESDEKIERVIQEFDSKGKLLILKKGLFNEIDIFKTRSPLMIVKIPEIEEWDRRLNTGCMLMIPYQDPANVGSVIRSAVGLGIKDIIILKEAANPFHPKSIRASSGAVFNARILRGISIYELDELDTKITEKIISLDMDGDDISVFKFPDNFILLPGLEGPGLPDSMKKNSVSIELDKSIESLNASVAASIVMYEWKKSRS